MRLLYLCADRGIPVLGTKGASTHVRAITSTLQRCGHSVTVACSRLDGPNTPPVVDRVVELASGDSGEVGALIEESRADAVVERYSLRSTGGLKACLETAVPLVLEVNAPLVWEASHYRGFTDIDGGLADERRLFDGADAVMVVSRALERYVSACSPATPVRWVPNGVDAARFSVPPAPIAGVGAGATVVGFVGSMKPWHGVADLVAAFCAIAPANPSLHLVLAGSGPEEDAARAAVPAALAGRVHLLGALPHAAVPGVVARFDLAVAPYRPGGEFYFCPLKVLEYLAAGCPVVYPPLGDIPELVGRGGLPYSPGDVGALGAAIVRLAGDPAARLELGRDARAAGRRWSWDRAASAVVDTVQAALEARAA